MDDISPDSPPHRDTNYPEKGAQQPFVVMIDDDADDYYLLTSVLKNSYPANQVIPIYDSSRVIAQLDALQELPAFLLLDLNMPLKNGFEVLQEVRSFTRYSSLPIVVYTSSSNPSDNSRCQAAGATDYIQKPNSYNELHQVIEKTWRHWLTSSLPPTEP
jgi:CheY-like chemotaxis protein